MMFLKKRTFSGGVKIQASKELTENLQSEQISEPEFIVLPLSMHIGAPARPLVQKGDYVLKGQLIAAAQGMVSANVHASVSGTVADIDKCLLPGGKTSPAVIIKNDFLGRTVTPKPQAPETLDAQTIRSLLLQYGITGMGGASFPTHVKYQPPKNGKIDLVILNGIECEPYLTADCRILLEKPKEVIRGLEYFLKASGAPIGIIAIEDNKPEAIGLFQKLLQNTPNIKVAVCAEKYPQGGEKQLIRAVSGRVVPQGGLPADVGVIVDNVSTAMQAAESIETGLPFTGRLITVSGNAVVKPGNYYVPLGTLYSHVLQAAARGLKSNASRIISGGPMMGFAVQSLDYPVTKGTGGLLFFDDNAEESRLYSENTCVRCGKCVDHCPMFLEPTEIAKAAKQSDADKLQRLAVDACIECGCCSYSCPAHIPLVQYIRLGKQLVRNKK